MYGAETWRVTKKISVKIQAFTDLWGKIAEHHQQQRSTTKIQGEKTRTQIRRKKLNWIGHTLRKLHNNVTKQAPFWNPQG